MIISEKQIMKLMSMCRKYANVCDQMIWKEDHEECKELHRQIENQQSEELKVISKDPYIINKDEHLFAVKCFKCKTEFLVHPLQNINTGYVTDCELHRKES